MTCILNVLPTFSQNQNKEKNMSLEIYEVKSSDTLWKIAEKFYKDGFMYIAEQHSSIQNNSQILQDILQRLNQMQSGLKAIRGPEVAPENADKSAISLSLDDIYLKGEIVKITARTINFNSQKLKAEITIISGNSFARSVNFHKQDSEWVLMIDDDDLTPGLYRLKVETGSYNSQAPSPVHDLFEVVK